MQGHEVTAYEHDVHGEPQGQQTGEDCEAHLAARRQAPAHHGQERHQPEVVGEDPGKGVVEARSPQDQRQAK